MSAVALQSFGFGDQLVRVTDREGAAWFVANDVCGALEIGNSRQAVSRLDDDERDDVIISDAIGRMQQTTIVSESGVYTLIFKSRKEAAVQFRRWITHDVIPALRRTGAYAMPQAEPAPPQFIDEPGMPEFAERIRVGLQLVREARIVFGREAARRAWVLAGLPDVSEPEPATPGLIACNIRQMSAWMEERVDLEASARSNASALYLDYAKWCDEGDEEPIGIRRFAAALQRMGITRVKSSSIQYLGVKLKPG